MEQVLAGIRVVEVASWTFVPSAGAILAEWGADVVKIEHPESGDPQRGLASAATPGGSVNIMLEVANRGKRSVGLDIARPEGRALLHRLLQTADVFITNHLPDVRRKLGIDVDQVREHRPDIVYVRGSANGPRGPEAVRGGFDGATYWSRGGVSDVMTDPTNPWPVARFGFGDLIAGLALAGGVSAALLRRERTGAGAVVDVSLLGTGAWNIAPDIARAALFPGEERPMLLRDEPANPLAGTFRTKDDRFVALAMFQFDVFWRDFCDHIDRPDLVADPRFGDAAARHAHRRENFRTLSDVFAARTLAEWTERFRTIRGVWSAVRTPDEVLADRQVAENGYLRTIPTGDGTSVTLPANPVQFDETPPSVTGAPVHGAHTDEILMALGLDMDELLANKAAGVIL